MPGQRLPFGYVRPPRVSWRVRLGLIVVGAILMVVAALVWQDLSQKDDSVSTLLHPCGHGRLPYGAVLGYIDGTIPVFSNCNERTISEAYAKFRRVGSVGREAVQCSVIDAAGVESLTPFGEELVGTKATANAPDGEPTNQPEGAVSRPVANCGVRTGMMWQCVELARRYLFLTKGVLFGSVDGAEDIFALTSVFKVARDELGVEAAEAAAQANPAKLTLPLDAIPNAHQHNGLSAEHAVRVESPPPQVGDLIIWGRQQGMPYGHVAVVTRVDPFVTKEESMFRNLDGERVEPVVTKERDVAVYDHLFDQKKRAERPQMPPRLLGENATDEDEVRAAIEAERRRPKPHVREGSTGREHERANEGASHLSRVKVETYEQVLSDLQRKAAADERAAMIARYKKGILRPGKDDDSINQIAAVYIAEQNYDSLAYDGRNYGRILALHKEEVRVGGCTHHLVDPDGYAIKGWMRVADHNRD